MEKLRAAALSNEPVDLGPASSWEAEKEDASACTDAPSVTKEMTVAV